MSTSDTVTWLPESDGIRQPIRRTALRLAVAPAAPNRRRLVAAPAAPAGPLMMMLLPVLVVMKVVTMLAAARKQLDVRRLLTCGSAPRAPARDKAAAYAASQRERARSAAAYTDRDTHTGPSARDFAGFAPPARLPLRQDLAVIALGELLPRFCRPATASRAIVEDRQVPAHRS